MISVLLYCMIATVFIPLDVYLTVKLGTYAFYRARYLFEQDHLGDRKHGEAT